MRKITVGISQFPPLVVKTGGKYSGFEIDLWEKIAKMLDLQYEYLETDFKHILAKLKKGKVDVGIAGISRTAEREREIDFTHFTLRSGLQIMLCKGSKKNIFGLFIDLAKANIGKIVLLSLISLLAIFLFANIFYWIERNSGTFSTSYLTGIGEAMWLAVVTISAVGYGDIVPQTTAGRIAGTFVIFFGYAIFIFLVAKLSSIFTLDCLRHKIESYHDLKGKKVATKAGTTSVRELNELGATVIETEEIAAAYELLGSKEVDAVVFDEPVIKNFLQSERAGGFVAVGDVFAPQTYGFAVRSASDLRESISREVLRLMETGEYEKLYQKWFGGQ